MNTNQSIHSRIYIKLKIITVLVIYIYISYVSFGVIKTGFLFIGLYMYKEYGVGCGENIYIYYYI
jgi:hypothetical protein